MENRCPTTSRRVWCLPCQCLLVGYGRFSPKIRNRSNDPADAVDEYPTSSCHHKPSHYILWSPTLVPEGPEFLRHLRGKQSFLVLGKSGRVPDVVLQRQADEPAKQDVVLDPLPQEADAADRVERLKQKRLQELLRRDRGAPGVGVHRRKLGGKVGKRLFDHDADRPKGMIGRNEGLRGAVAEHPVGLEVRSAHKFISLIMKGFYAEFYHGNRIFVT